MSKIKVILIIFLFLLCSFTQVNAANINFGSITAKETISKDMIINMTQNDDIDFIEVFLDNDLQSEKNNKLTGCLKVKTQKREISLIKDPVRIKKDELYNDINGLFIILSLTINPDDIPGDYSGIMKIKEYNSSNTDKANNIIEKTVECQVNPWVKIKTEETRITVDRLDLHSSKITSDHPNVLKVASNTPWKLYVVFDKDQIEGEILDSNNFKIEFMGDINYEQVGGKSAKDGLIIVLSGQKTVIDQKYWLDLPFSINIKDFTKVAAGNITFPLVFIVSSL